MKTIFTAEELAELAAFDAEIDDEPVWDPGEIKAAAERDFEARQQAREPEARKAAEYQRGYRAANKEAIAEYQRGYRAASSDETAEKSSLRRWRREHGYSQARAARVLGVCQATISNIERGVSPMPEEIREVIGI